MHQACIRPHSLGTYATLGKRRGMAYARKFYLAGSSHSQAVSRSWHIICRLQHTLPGGCHSELQQDQGGVHSRWHRRGLGCCSKIGGAAPASSPTSWMSAAALRCCCSSCRWAAAFSLAARLFLFSCTPPLQASGPGQQNFALDSCETCVLPSSLCAHDSI